MAIELQDEALGGKQPQAAKNFSQWTSRLFEEKPTVADRILFTEGLALQLEAGVALHSALQSLLLQLENPRMKRIVEELIAYIIEGGKFSDALSRHPQLFSTTYVNLIGVSESGGFLPEVLTQLVEMDERQSQMRAACVSAISYPAFLLTFSIGVVVFILVAVFPKFGTMFAAIYSELPITTKVLMQASEVMRKYPAWIVAGLGGTAFALANALRDPRGKAWLDRQKLKLPLIRAIFLHLYLGRLMRTMGVSLQRGVTILATLEACREVIPNQEFRRFILDLENTVTQGKGIALGFRQAYFVPPAVLQMISTGEEAGELGHVMNRIADFYDRELAKRLAQLSKLAEPVMLLVMGTVVGVIVSSLILPIFKLSKGVH